ncbi:MAG TPA: TatD family hydrolase [Bacteroidia bacterium]|jgi:TatD DNase family protein
MVFIDTHTHLYSEQFNSDRQAMIQRALDAGVDRLFLPNIDSGSIPSLFALCKQFPGHCFPMMGLHPCSVNNKYNDELKVVEHWLEKMRFYAIGEIGIDLYWDKTFVNQQKDAFAHQIDLAKRYDLPIVIHTRNSFSETYEIVAGMNDRRLKGIFHCFTGTVDDAKRIIALGGFKMGIGGVLTFKNSGLDKVLEEVDLKYLVLETDSPYLAPVPYRGKRNESAYIPLIAEKLAMIKGTTVEEVARITTQNALEIFEL